MDFIKATDFFISGSSVATFLCTVHYIFKFL